MPFDPLERLRRFRANPLGALARLYRRPLPKISGRARLPGLREPVEVLRDTWGVPHIYAQNEEDVTFAQGYVHAQDRLWQMELNRRLGHGRLAELFGPLAFETDRLLRTVGLARSAQLSLDAADPETRRLLDAYARGVNAFLDAPKRRLPLELTLLGIAPEPWRPIDSLAWGQMMAWGLSTNWDSELVNGALVARLGAERAARLKGEYPEECPLIVPGETWAALYDQVRARFTAAEPHLPLAGFGGMSNNWVVDGEKSVTGKPLLANDPHLSLQMPSIWYQNHLVCPELEVTGVSLPGAPGVVIGHNAQIAWGFTAALPDTADLFIEKRHPEREDQFEYQGRWETVTFRREEICVKGETPRAIDVVLTRNGPILSDLTGLARCGAGHALALRWTGQSGNRIHRAILGINRANDWSTFRRALGDWDAPSMHAVYADRAGNIGYQMTGRVPIRKHGLNLTPVPGWTGEHDWVGTIPPEELPHAFNPPQHYLASANNRTTGPDYPHALTAETMNGFRARRIVELLTEKQKLSADDFARMHVDQLCTPAKALTALYAERRTAILAEPVVQSKRTEIAWALNQLAGWDHVLSASSVAGTIYELALYFAQRRLFEPLCGDGDLTGHFMGVGFHPVLNPTVIGCLDRTQLVAMRILGGDEREWLEGTTRDAVLAGALYDALHYLVSAHGTDPTAWTWGAVHPAGMHHPLGAKRPLDKIFNRGPFPYGGDTNTVWQAAFVPKLPISPAGGFTASWRQILDLSDWDASRAIHTTGQSGHPASPHYDDMIALWLKGEYHPLLWSRARVEAHLEGRLDLEPA